MSDKKLITGIKPTGTPHIGNYIGAIRPALNHSSRKSFFFVADYHALTTCHESKALQESIYQVAATWLACGLNPNRSYFYRQSAIPEIFELHWILSCLSPKGLLNRSHAYKTIVDLNSDAKKDPDKGINTGLFTYPILMAADILIFNSSHIPVGQDQKQHVEIARDIAETFNKTYQDVFIVPQPIIQSDAPTIPGTDGRKMSKSYNNVIPIFSSESDLKKKIMEIKTAPLSIEDPKDPASCPVFQLYKQFATPTEVQQLSQQYTQGGMGYGTAKTLLFDAINNEISPMRTQYNAFISHPKKIDEALSQQLGEIRKIAQRTLTCVKSVIGV